ncbi:MAG: hypothetical protein IT373_30180 [Polyangiaceae bacterium]|nr:hypothetical protein [Polyangiaceae bacterium]
MVDASPLSERDRSADGLRGDDRLSAPPPSSLRGRRRRAADLAGWLGRASRMRIGLTGAAAWLITVAPVAWSGRSPALLRLLAVAALGPALGGALVVRRRPTLGRHLGLTLYPLLCVAAWLWAAGLDVALTSDVYRAILGALSWAVFALAWVHPWSVSDERLLTAPVGKAAGFAPRRRPSPWSMVIAAGSVAAAVGVLGIGWLSDEPSRGVLAHAIGAAAAVALVTVACSAAVLAGRAGETRHRFWTRGLARSVLLMVVTAALAVAGLLTRP